MYVTVLKSYPATILLFLSASDCVQTLIVPLKFYNDLKFTFLHKMEYIINLLIKSNSS